MPGFNQRLHLSLGRLLNVLSGLKELSPRLVASLTFGLRVEYLPEPVKANHIFSIPRFEASKMPIWSGMTPVSSIL